MRGIMGARTYQSNALASIGILLSMAVNHGAVIITGASSLGKIHQMYLFR
jgi:hydrogenase-4 membrane subunit HyfE